MTTLKLLVLLFCGLPTFISKAQVGGQPPLPYHPNFSATLDGNGATPPDNSPWTATAQLVLSYTRAFLASTVIETNVLSVFLHFPGSHWSSPLVDHLTVSVQRENGQ